MINKHRKHYNPKNNLASMPIEHIGKFYNACTDPCDMLSGPCACGATHKQEEWPDWLQLEVFGFVSDKYSFIKRKERKNAKGGKRKVADVPSKSCQHSEHNPPSLYILNSGVYEHICSQCRKKKVFRVEFIYRRLK